MQTHQPDLILSDIKMPIMDGIQMAIIAKDYYPSVKFIFLSGYKDFEYAQQALKLNAIDYLTKPVMTEHLLEVLKKAESVIRQEQKVTHIMEKGYPSIQRHFISQLMYDNFVQASPEVFQAFDINLSNGFGVVGFADLKSIENIPPQTLMNLLQYLLFYRRCQGRKCEYDPGDGPLKGRGQMPCPDRGRLPGTAL